MPYLKIQTNQAIDESAQSSLLKSASTTVASQLGKAEDFVMVTIDPPQPMLFAGQDKPTAYLELKSIGLPESQTATLSTALCNLVADELDIDKNRIYIEFTNSERSMWGWDGRTF